MEDPFKLVLLTGANGTIGYRILVHLLRDGYRIRCVVRREEAINQIRHGSSVRYHLEHVASASQKAELLTFAIVPDMTLTGAYSAAMKDVEYVIHVAGPWPVSGRHPDTDIFHPFVASMDGILSAATAAGTVRRIVFTQAGAGLIDIDDPEFSGSHMRRTLDELARPNETAAKLRPPLQSVHHAYSAAKSTCMTRLLRLKQEGGMPFSIIQIIPGTVVAPMELASTSAQARKKMDRMSCQLLFDEMRPRFAFGFIHADDCAAIHVNALDELRVPNKELLDFYIAAGNTGDMSAVALWREVAEELEERFHEEVTKGVFRIGREGPLNMPFSVNSDRTRQALLKPGTRLKSLKDCVIEVAAWYRDLALTDENLGRN